MNFDWAQLVDLGYSALPVLKIIWIDLILSGDNAVVIALACRSLPEKQRMLGIILGAGVAILLRIAFAGVITTLLAVTYLKLVAGLLLFWIAVKLLLGDDEDDPSIKSHDRLWRAVMTVAIADAVMSLDNVIAVAAAADGSVALIAFGIALSIPLIVFGSTLVLALMKRFPIVIWLGSALLGWIAGELLANEPELKPLFAALSARVGIAPDLLHHGVAVVGMIGVLLAGWFLVDRARRRAEVTG